MSSPSKKKRTRSKSTTSSGRARKKRVRRAPSKEAPKDAPGAPIPDGLPSSAAGEPVLEDVVEPAPEPVPQPVIGSPLLPEEAPDIVTGYIRLIILGLSFFFAVYLGLEAFSIFVNFPTKLPISSLLITYGHLSDMGAAYTLVGLLVAEVGVVQVWAWRTRRANLYEEYEEEEGQAPTVPPEESPTQPSVPTGPLPIAQVAQAPTVPAVVQAPAQPATVPDELRTPIIAAPPVPAPPEPVAPAPIASPEVPKTEPAVVAPPKPPQTPPPAEPPAVAVPPPIAAAAEVAQQEQKSGLFSQFQPQPAAEQAKGAQALPVPVVDSAVLPPRGFEVKKKEGTEPTDAAAARSKFVTTYQIYPNHSDVYVGIEKDPETGGYRYIVVEPRLSPTEKQVYQRLTRLMVDELEVDMSKLKNNKSAEAYLIEEAKSLARKYKIGVAPESYKKIAYYFTRDYIKLGKIEVLMNDPRIEDVSCDGPNIPLFIWHRDYESIPTNVIFESEEELNTFASKLAYVSGKHISIASPIVDATLPDGSRIQITYGREITKKGSTFTIRKFKGDPITIVDLLKYNTLSPELGAYLWYLIEKRMSLLVAGGTASGKTTTLNALSMFIPPDQKIVSVEDTPELNLSHKNWIQSVTRGGGVAGEITLFDLLKAAMRQRPDIIIVGEVRGVEAFTLFQAIATGHGGLGTVHADSVEAAINRLTTEPMNVPKSLLGSTLDCLIMQLRIKMKDKSVRRMVHVAEIVGHDANNDQIVLNNAFKWDPVSDKYLFAGRSRLFDKVTKRYGTPPEKIRQDIEDRKIFLSWLVKQNIRDYRDLSQQIRDFYSDPNMAVEKAMQALEGGAA